MMETVSFGLLLGQFADAMHRLGVDLALHLRDVDQLRGRIAGICSGLAGRRGHGGGGIGRRGAVRRWPRPAILGGQHAPDQRAHHHEQHDQAEQRHHAELDDVHDVVLGELQLAEPAGRLG